MLSHAAENHPFLARWSGGAAALCASSPLDVAAHCSSKEGDSCTGLTQNLEHGICGHLVVLRPVAEDSVQHATGQRHWEGHFFSLTMLLL